MYSYIEQVGLGAALNLGLLLPLFLVAFGTSRHRKAAAMPVLLFVVLFTLDMALVFSFKLYEFIPAWGHWNWQGKLLEAAWPVALALLVPVAFPPKEMGLVLPAEPKRSGRVLLICCVLYALIGIPLMLLMGAHFGISGDLPTFAYEATMPGLGEELVYRGALLMLLNQAFGRPWKLAGIQFGWGFIIVTFMFGFLHGVGIQPGHSPLIVVSWVGMLFPLITGAVLAWIRERTGSVWPGVLFHNFVNVLNHFLV
ncbi:MAG TPA: CPBP family intramembrane glutamic endopeptidase [Gammaproteobacteria bacterium]|nr:CPBP family intramembrane glutamic endopeptidase [Gammaproteobacteria bacterium]